MEGNRERNVPDTITKILSYIEQNYQRNLSLELVAEHMGLHPNYICKLFKKTMNTTFLIYLHEYRIHKAKALIQTHPDWPLHTISVLAGYEDTRHFFKVFKKYEQVTPGQFRLNQSP